MSYHANKIAPVFVVGAGRSGTTVFFDLLTCHSAFGFLTTYDDMLSSTPFFGFARRLFESGGAAGLGTRRDYYRVHDYSSLKPRKTEAYRFWEKFAGPDFGRSYLWTRRPEAKQSIQIQAKIDRICRLQKRSLFAAKLTGPGRIGFIRGVFPKARFIHVVRDSRSQVHSTLNVGFWKAGGGLEHLWWNDDIPNFLTDYLNDAVKESNAIALAAAQWCSVVTSIRLEAEQVLAAEEYREIAYEDFVADPLGNIVDLWHWLKLEEDLSAVFKVKEFPIKQRNNTKWINEFSQADLATLDRWASGLQAGVGL